MELYTWFLVGLLVIVTIIGIPGNILVLLVYANKTKRTGTRVFILGLAGMDLFICALSGYRFYLWIYEDSFSSDFACRFFSWIGLASELSSAFVTTAVAVDRYLAICRPHLGWMTHKRAQIVCFSGIVASTVLTLPSVAIYLVSIDTSGKQSRCEITGLEAYRYWVYVALFVMTTAFATMMITSLAMYMLIYREVRKRLKVRPSVIVVAPADKLSNREAGRSNNLTELLIVGDSMIGLSLSLRNASADVRRHSIGEAEGIAKKLFKPRNRTATVSPVLFRRSFKENNERPTGEEKTVKIGNCCVKDCEEKRNIAIGTTGSSSEDTGSGHGPKTKLTADHNETIDRAIKKGKKSKTGKMLLLATVVFVVTWSARLLMWLISYMLAEKWTDLRNNNHVAFAFLSLLQHLYYTTPAVNPAIYSFVNNRFREECLKFIRKMNCIKGSNM